MTQIKEGLQKQPSPELLSLIKAAAQSLLGFGELWGAIKQKGADEGFKETDLQDMLRPLLRDRLGMSKDKIYYLFHQEQEKERTRTNRYIPKILENKDPEQSDHDWHDVQGEKEEELMEKAEEKNQQQDEEPTELELANIKIAQLEDALKKMENFKPAAAFSEEETNTILVGPTEDYFWDWLAKREDKVSCYWYPNYGIELFRTRILTDLKGRGVKTFKRLYFEV